MTSIPGDKRTGVFTNGIQGFVVYLLLLVTCVSLPVSAQQAATDTEAFLTQDLEFPDGKKAITVLPHGWRAEGPAALAGPDGERLLLESKTGRTGACESIELAASFVDFPSDPALNVDLHPQAEEWTRPRGADDACLAFIMSGRAPGLVVRAALRAHNTLYTLRTERMAWTQDMENSGYKEFERDINIIINYFYFHGSEGYKQLMAAAAGKPLTPQNGGTATSPDNGSKTNGDNNGGGATVPKNTATLPRDADLLRAERLKLKGRYDEAEAIYLGLMTKTPFDSHNGLGDIYARTGRYQEAIQQFQSAMLLRPNEPDTYNGLGSVYFYQQDWDNSEKYFNQALERDPENAVALTNLGWVALARGDLEKARENFSMALVAGPDDNTRTGLYTGLAQIAMAEGDPESALIRIEELLRSEPENAAAHATASTVYTAMGDYKNALKTAAQAAKLDPSQHKYHALEAFAAMALEKYGNAEAALLKAIDTAPEDDPALPSYHKDLARTFFQRGSTDKARAILEDALKKFPDNEELTAALEEIQSQ